MHEREKTYGFEPVKAFWFTGRKSCPNEGEFDASATLTQAPAPVFPASLSVSTFTVAATSAERQPRPISPHRSRKTSSYIRLSITSSLSTIASPRLPHGHYPCLTPSPPTVTCLTRGSLSGTSS